MAELTRRDVFRGAGVIAGAGALAGTGAAEATATSGSGDYSVNDSGNDSGSGVRITQGTNISAHVSPDGGHVAFDLVTAIWTVPVTGGTATRLTGDDTDATQPSWSPDGRSIVFQAFRDGNYHLYTMRRDGSGVRQLTSGPFDHREPRFSPARRSRSRPTARTRAATASSRSTSPPARSPHAPTRRPRRRCRPGHRMAAAWPTRWTPRRSTCSTWRPAPPPAW